MTEFAVGDRVKAWYQRKWYSGVIHSIVPKSSLRFTESSHTIAEKIFGKFENAYYPVNNVPEILVKTDERVDDSPDSLLQGYGLRIQEYPNDNVVLIHEGDKEEDPEEKLRRICSSLEKEVSDDVPF